MIKSVQLTKGLYAVVDESDYELVSQYTWHVRTDPKRFTYYARGIVDGKNVSMHRFLMKPADGLEVDHIDGNTLNNTRSNLRVCTRTRNAQNSKPKRRGSAIKGVFHSSAEGRWRAQIRVNGKTISLGSFATELDAARAYDRAAIVYFDDFAKTNFKKTGEVFTKVENN